MDKNVLSRRIIAAVVSFVLTVSVTALALCAVIGISCSSAFFTQEARRSGYITAATESLLTDLGDVAIPSGLPTDFFETRLGKDILETRILNAFGSHIEGKTPDFSVEEIHAEFYNMLRDYALTQNRVISDESEEALNGFADECTERYLTYANPSSVKLVLTYFPLIRKYIGFGAAVSALLAATSAALLFFLCRKKDLGKHLYFSFSATALLLGVIPAIILISKEVQKIAITGKALYSLIVGFFEGILTLAVIFAAFFLLLALSLILIKFIISKKQKPNI
ncbi:MAG: hypothetical protein J6V50_01765 [Clostridia bacterium]|nr:hypothetical protein [Clostridia bacterium]